MKGEIRLGRHPARRKQCVSRTTAAACSLLTSKLHLFSGSEQSIQTVACVTRQGLKHNGSVPHERTLKTTDLIFDEKLEKSGSFSDDYNSKTFSLNTLKY